MVNYALEVLAARQERDAAIERARGEARRQIARARAERDRQIRRLRAQDPTISMAAIGRLVGCSRETVYDVLNPEKHERYNRRRREHWRRRAEIKALIPADTPSRFAGVS